MENHFSLEAEYIGNYVNREGIRCIKGINKSTSTEFDHTVHSINNYFTIRVTNSRLLEKVEKLQNGDLILVDGHLKQDIRIRPSGGSSYEPNFYADSITSLGDVS